MKLLLMSSTFTNDALKNTFLNLLSKPPSETKVIIIHQAEYIRNTYPEYVEMANTMLSKDITLLSELGILKGNITAFDTESSGKPDLSEVDVLFVQGGNAFYYLSQIKKQEYWDAIRDYVERDGVYVGISAGSMIMSPTVDEYLTWDENFDGIEDVSGFGFVPFYLLVHWDTFFKGRHTMSVKHSWKNDQQVIALTDQQAVLVTDEGFTIISPDQ